MLTDNDRSWDSTFPQRLGVIVPILPDDYIHRNGSQVRHAQQHIFLKGIEEEFTILSFSSELRKEGGQGPWSSVS